MNKIAKKFIIIMLFLFSVTYLVGCGTAKKVTLDDFDYEFVNDKYVVLTKYIGSETHLKVKGEYDGLYVDYMLPQTFAFNENIEEVVIQGVAAIPDYAFEGCTNLKSVTLKTSIKSIGAYAFKGCVNLEYIKIDGAITNIEPTAFLDCAKLSEVKIGTSSSFDDEDKRAIFKYNNGKKIIVGIDEVFDSFASIGKYAFFGRDALTKVELPASITSIDSFAFGNCDNLVTIRVDKGNSIYDSRENCNAIIESNTDKLVIGCKNTIIPNDIQAISSYAFAYVSGLTGLNIPASIKNIETNAFYNCKDIKTITISPNNYTYDNRDNSNAIIETQTNRLILACDATVISPSVKTIGSYSFTNTNIENLVIPEGVETIEDYAFAEMTSLKSISLPSTLKTIGKNVFEGCTNLEAITVNESNEKFDSRNNSNTIIETETNKIIYACKNSKIDNSIEVIGAYSFANLTNLNQLIIPDNVKVIENNAFENCKNISNLIISDSVTTIGVEAFKGCSGFDTLKIPNSVTSIASRAFMNCTGIINIIVDSANQVYESNNNNAIVEKATKALVLGCSHTTIADDIKTIKAYAFYGSKLKKLNIPANVTLIETKAFSGCMYLAEITVASGNANYEDRGLNGIIDKANGKLILGCKNTTFDEDITAIAAYAFDAAGIIHFNVTEIEKIESFAFNECELLNYLYIDNSVKTIESKAIYNCYNAYTYESKVFGKDGYADDYLYFIER